MASPAKKKYKIDHISKTKNRTKKVIFTKNESQINSSKIKKKKLRKKTKPNKKLVLT